MIRIVAALAVTTQLGCATTPAPKAVEPVVGSLDGESVPCTPPKGPLELVRGRVPEGAIVLARGSTTAQVKRVTLSMHEHVARDLAKQRCAEGVSILQAEEENSSVRRTTIAVWRRRLEGEEVIPVDAGPSEP